MDGSCSNKRVYLQKKETVKGCTDDGPVKEPPMPKSGIRSLNQDISFESIKVIKRAYSEKE